MKRTLGSLVIIAALLSVAVSAEVQLGRNPRQDPLGRELLYLPSPEMLKIISLGHPGLVADVLYLWSIQYYSLFEPHERFLYLETIYNLITDLDPLYFDAYRIGALIMQIPTGGDQEELARAVRRLFDKGSRRIGSSRRRPPGISTCASRTAGPPSTTPKSRRNDPVLHRASSAWSECGVTRRASGHSTIPWSTGAARWRRPRTGWTEPCADRAKLQPVLDAYVGHFGRCAGDWREVVRVGLLSDVPLDLVGNPYGIDAQQCRVVALKKIKNQ
jgi:hypothetical protein